MSTEAESYFSHTM